MFKLLILQQLYNISDEELEYQVKDRLSFMQFLGLGLEDTVQMQQPCGYFISNDKNTS
jgi:transposase, IS5 family